MASAAHSPIWSITSVASSLAGSVLTNLALIRSCGLPRSGPVISHDRWFLDRVCTHVLAFEGESQGRWFEGNFEAYE